MKRIKSETFFHAKPENLNCAQSVLKGFQQELSIPQSRIDDFRAFGGGRARGGLCGALYAAETLLTERGKLSVLQQFRDKAGGIACREIKRDAKTPCMQCVSIADELLEQNLNI